MLTSFQTYFGPANFSKLGLLYVSIFPEKFNAYKLSSKITPPQENEMQAKSNTIILHDKIHTQSCITQQVQSERKAAHMEGDTYQEVIHKGAFPENDVVLNNFPNSSNIENNVHNKINYLTPRKQIYKEWYV